GSCVRAAMTAPASPSCGMARGLTNDVASTTGRPASASILMNRIFCSVGTNTFSFCSPFRGPTSTTRTEEGSVARLNLIHHTPLSNNAKVVVKRNRYFDAVYLLHACPSVKAATMGQV